MLRKIIVAAAAVTLLAGMATVAYSKSRHHSGFRYAPSYGYSRYAPSYGYSAGDRTDPTNTNGY